MNNEAIYVLATKSIKLATKAVQKKLEKVEKMKAFFGLRCPMEMLLHKDKY